MSIQGQNLQAVTAVAAGVITEDSFVSIDASTAFPGQTVVKLAGAGDRCDGVSCNAAAAAGDAVVVCVGGWGKHVKTGATPNSITPGSQVAADGSGLAVKNTDALYQIGGIALATTDTASEFIPIIVTPGASVLAAS